MRTSILLTAVLLAGCSQGQPQSGSHSSEMRSFDVAEEPASAPGIGVTAAPGVAFNYRYAFRLPNTRIAQIQEAHAQACEKLGLAKCRITGMRYRLVNQQDIEASLALRLDPAIARQFGKNATDAVKSAQGMLVDQEITGEDIGSQIKAGDRSKAQLQSDLDKVEADLRGLSAKDPKRGELVDSADQLRAQLRSLSETRAQGEEALAGTPMVFNYGSGSVVPGFDVNSPLKSALQRSSENFIAGFAAILVILITLLPWALVLGAAVLLFRLARRRFGWGARTYKDEEPQSGGDA